MLGRTVKVILLDNLENSDMGYERVRSFFHAAIRRKKYYICK
jgi:hypothetical protein